MPVVLVATVGSGSANSYATRDEFLAYLATRPVEWDGTEEATDAEVDDQNRALITATAMLDEYVDWDGHATDDVQALAWPRFGLLTKNGYIIPTTVLPDLLKRATCELACQLLFENRAEDSDAQAQGLKELQVGPVDLVFRDGTISAKAIPDRVWRMVAQWGLLMQSPTSVEAQRV